MDDDATHLPVTVTDAPTAEDLAALRARIAAHNREHHPSGPDRPVACFVRDHDGELVAGGSGATWWGWLTVEHLWVAASQRGSGLGAQVLGALEDEARRRGCGAVCLDTFSFQAKPFYERQGYAQFGELPDFPEGATRHFLWKRL
jgi:GNAT superfamily N-acetyltransferase